MCMWMGVSPVNTKRIPIGRLAYALRRIGFQPTKNTWSGTLFGEP